MTPDPTDLLVAAIADPFVQLEDVIPAHEAGSTFAIEDWYRLVRAKAPLWCFNPWAFKALRTDGVESSAPLSRIVNQLASDEGTDLMHLARKPTRRKSVSALERHLYARRATLRDERKGVTWIERTASGSLWVETNEAHGFRAVSDTEADYFGLGVELMHRVESLVTGRSKVERDEARGDLDAFVGEIGGKLARGRPEKGAESEILRALFAQGKWLFEVCWRSLATTPSDATKAILEELGSTKHQRRLWAVRLALPMFSVKEIRALRLEAAKPPGRNAHVAPRRFTVFCLAHRLGERPFALASKLPPKEDARAFFAKPGNVNPIRA